MAHAGDRTHGGERPQEVFRFVHVHGSVDNAGRDGAEANVFLCIFDRQTARHGFNAALCDYWHGPKYASNRLNSQRSGDAPDAAISLLCKHLLHGSQRHVKEALEVNSRKRREVFCRVIREGLANEDASDV
jgi:hypothetical protein